MLDGARENAAMQNHLKTYFAFFVGTVEAVATAASGVAERTDCIARYKYICVHLCLWLCADNFPIVSCFGIVCECLASPEERQKRNQTGEHVRSLSGCCCIDSRAQKLIDNFTYRSFELLFRWFRF